ncbi:hypothetical protein KI387_039449, partial [Taxus chinensis]
MVGDQMEGTWCGAGTSPDAPVKENGSVVASGAGYGCSDACTNVGSACMQLWFHHLFSKDVSISQKCANLKI